MTSTSKTAGATIAVALVIAGVVMAAIALNLEADSRALTGAFRGPIASPIETGATMQPPVGEVNIGQVTYLPRPEPVRVVARPARVKPTCVPYWRELVQGPAGRRVAISCPGATVPPPPPPAGNRLSELTRLPSLEELGDPLPRRGIKGGIPDRDEALGAARRVANQLSETRAAGAAGAAAEPAPGELPVGNALGWRACTADRSVAMNATGTADRC